MRLFASVTFIAAVVLAASAAPGASSAQQGPGSPGTFVSHGLPDNGSAQTSNEITVRFKPGVTHKAMTQLNARTGAAPIAQGSRSALHRFRVKDADAALRAYRASPLVEEAALSRNARILEIPNDPNFGFQWHMRSTDGGVWADTAWDLATTDGAGTTVAVIDTGVAYENHNGSLGGSPQTFVRASDLGTTTFVAPWDFVYDEPHANDDHGHGTHVTGTITEDRNNGIRMTGVAPNSTIMPIKAIDYLGDGTETDIADAILYAVDNGADVISMSLGFPGTGAPNGNGDVCTEIAGLNAALDYADAQGVTVIAASGNDGGNTVLCPAAHPSVIAVGATRFDAQVTSYSNKGSALDITAPGGDMFVDQSGDGYGDGVLQESFCYDSTVMLLLNLYGSFCDVFNMGTSMATPHVAGVAALLLGEDPTLTPDEVRSLLQATSRDRGPAGRDDSYGWGIVDAAGAVASLLGVPVPPPPVVPGLDPPTNLAATALSTSRIDLTWTDNATAETGYKIERSFDGVNFTQIAMLPANYQAYSNTNLLGGTSYTYRVRAHKGPDHTAYSNTSTATTQPVPAAPSGLGAVAVSSSRINLTWTDNSSNEQGFKIERSTDGANWLQVGTVGANLTSMANTNLMANTTYTYRVRSFEGPNHSSYSSTASATTGPGPAAPSNLTAIAVSSSRINLAWADNSSNEAGFKVERSTDGVSFMQVATLLPNTTSYANMSLGPGTTYHYRVRSFDGPNNSAYTNTASATTQGGPAAPSNLTATAVSSSRIDLAWTDNATNEAGFKVERSTDGVTFTQIALLLANATSWANTSLPAATTYTYRVRAYESANHSAFSNSATATTFGGPAAPTNLTASPVGSSRINLAWTDNAANEAGFKIERSMDGVVFIQVATTLANVASYSDSNLTANTSYIYRVRAYEGLNNSAYSNNASATTGSPPAAPSNLTATAISRGRVRINWTDNAGTEQGFKLERSTDGVTFVQVAQLGPNTTMYTNGGLTAGVTYYFRIRTYDGPNHSAYSNIASVVAP
jgi:subtilisin family serine protease